MQLKREDAARVARAGGEMAERQALALFELVGELTERVEALERRLGRNSRNSSLPPSSDRPDRQARGKDEPKRERKRSGRKQGGQDGHTGHGRALAEEPDEIVEHRPERCRKCGRELTGADRAVGRAARHQVIELPDTVVVTTEHRLVKLRCAGCRTHTRAELPEGVEPGAFGPRLRATVVMLAVMLLSRRATVTLLGDMFGAKISVGSVQRILEQASDALKAPWEAIQRAVQAAEVAHADETSWRRAGQRIWLWAALSATAACYRIDPSRARPAAKALLGTFDGLLICDRYSVYDFIDPARRQACLSHLARNFQALAERPGACGEHGRRIRGLIDDVIRADTKARAGGQQIAWHTGPLNDIHDRLMNAVEAGERSRTPQLSRLCATVLDIWPTLWNFTEHSDAEATNNRCERAIRHAVLWRKTSLGTQTEAGDRFVERILSIRETCRLNQQPLHSYLTDVHNARLAGQPIPSPLAAA
ncbi:MAG: IS66 family transposase [Solirubrobacterales bacterium]|nr:IS66 family transposase [Solirubrobacterales bacterium]